MLPVGLSVPLLALFAATPAVYAWWRGRRIRRLPDDVLLADRLEAERRRNAYMSAVTSTALVIVGGWQSLWAIPLSIVLLIAADFPLRRQVFGETWTLPQYLRFWLHWLVASGGFWILLGISPLLITLSEGLEPLVAAAAAIAMIGWNVLFDRAFRALLRAKELRDPVLLDAFKPVVERASVPSPHVWTADLRGSAVVTAFALPKIGRGSVLFLSPLLERLPLREIVAVFAHEIGHLEQFTPRALRLINAVTLVTIAIAVLLPFLAKRFAPAFAGMAVMCWPLIVVALVVLRTRLHRPLGFDSDRRAAVLCGDPDAVASALIRLNALARMPRRVDFEIEQWQSHPSLARRVQALRALAGAPAAETREAVTFTTLNPAGTVTFEANGVRFGPPRETAGSAPPDGGRAETVMPYSQIHELRLDLKNAGRPSLIYRDVHGRVKQIALREDDAAAVQAVLDEVDVLLAPTMSSGASAAQRGALVALSLSLIAVFWAASVSVFVPAALASFRASAPTLAAAAAAGISGGALLWWTDGHVVFPAGMVMAALGLTLAIIARRSRAGDLDGRQRLLVVTSIVVLTVGVAATWGLGPLAQGITALRLHRALAMNPALTVLPLSLATLLASYPPAASFSSLRRSIFAVGAGVLLILGLVPVVAATPQFARRTIHDPLMAGAPRFDVTAARIAVTHRFHVGIEGDDVRLSPRGRWVSSAFYDERDSETVRFTLVSRDGTRLHLDAAELAFVDDDHVLAATTNESGVDLTAYRLASELPIVWRQRLPKFGLAQLDVSTGSRAWQVWGWTEDAAAIRFDGVVAEQGFDERRWGGGDEIIAQGLWFVGSGEYAIRLEGFDSQTPSIWAVLAQGVGSRLFARGYRRIAIVDGSGSLRPIESELTASCVSPPVGEPRITCSAFDGIDTHVFQLGARIVPVTVVRGALWLDEQHEDGTLVGTREGDRVLIQPASRRVVVLRGEGDEGWFEMAYVNGLAAITSFGDDDIVVGRVVPN